MAKKRKKSNVNKADYSRVVLTETAPYEVPIIFSNEGFYKNCLRYIDQDDFLLGLFKKIVDEPIKKHTIPLLYKIRKNEVSLRTLSILHPKSQWEMIEFYKQYSGLICYYCSVSQSSLRYPSKIGSTFFYQNENQNINKYKTPAVDTVDKDQKVKNPASYFSYGGYDRQYKFFNSKEFLSLETKYSIMWRLDVSKCFDSIYTHSLSWATKSKEFSKEHINNHTFADNFDKLMQQSNYNETNGICIGPEISRIFAEIILQDIDLKCVKKLSQKGLQEKRDYTFKRYVDDYFVFAKDEEIVAKVSEVLSSELLQYKLHINEGKLEKHKRPFFTNKSKIVRDVSIEIDDFIDQFTNTVLHERRLIFPTRIFKANRLVNAFIRKVKSLCLDSSVGYDMVSNYVIASLGKRVQSLVEDYRDAKKKEEIYEQDYATAIGSILEIMFFFYTVEPSVASSYNLSKSIVLSSRFFDEEAPDFSKTIKQKVFNLSLTYLRRHQKNDDRYEEGTVPLEMLNIFLSIGELGKDYLLPEDFIADDLLSLDKSGYLELTTCLYYIKDYPEYSNIRDVIKNRVLKLLLDKKRIVYSAEEAGLFLDILTCPYLDQDFRSDLLQSFRAENDMPAISKAKRVNVLSEMAKNPWFINWGSIDLLNLLEKKELSAVY